MGGLGGRKPGNGLDERPADRGDQRPVKRLDKEGHRKGRGATTSPSNRFSSTASAPADDGWGTIETLGAEREGQVETVDLPDRTVKLITRNRSPDIPFEHSINAYKGCEHGCVYCFARPTHSFLDLSPGLDCETRIFY